MQTPDRVDHLAQPKDTFDETKCVDLFTMPSPIGGAFDEEGAWAPYKDGWIVCGARQSNGLE